MNRDAAIRFGRVSVVWCSLIAISLAGCSSSGSGAATPASNQRSSPQSLTPGTSSTAASIRSSTISRSARSPDWHREVDPVTKVRFELPGRITNSKQPGAGPAGQRYESRVITGHVSGHIGCSVSVETSVSGALYLISCRSSRPSSPPSSGRAERKTWSRRNRGWRQSNTIPASRSLSRSRLPPARR
jgi:hypothetical protein